MNKVTIMRGLPGSGKSLYVDRFRRRAVVCSADDFWLDDDGVYVYDEYLAPKAHASCLLKFLKALKDNVEHVVVDNTNIHVHEYAPYSALAEAFGCELNIVTVKADLTVCIRRQTHGVPISTMERMAEEFEETLPRHKQFETIG